MCLSPNYGLQCEGSQLTIYLEFRSDGRVAIQCQKNMTGHTWQKQFY